MLRSLDFKPGDEILTTNHTYNACRNALNFIADRSGASVVVARVPFPIASADDVAVAVLAHTSPRTRLALLDHVTSQSGLIFPIDRLDELFFKHGIEVPVFSFPAPPERALRISAQIYNDEADYRALADALRGLILT